LDDYLFIYFMMLPPAKVT